MASARTNPGTAPTLGSESRDMRRLSNTEAGVAGSASAASMRVTARLLLHWFQGHGRAFPWRNKRAHPYPILVAEVLLKKTAAAAVVPIYLEFMRRYPTPASLARARKSALVRLIQPIGLSNQRSDQLKRLGQVLDATTAPASEQELLKLPGVGQYTAAVAASICFSERRVGVDTNVVRVLTRVYGVEGSRSEARKSPEFWSLAEKLAVAAHGRVAELNWALLDLGALVCKSKDPLCGYCPLGSHCEFGRPLLRKAGSGRASGG